MNKYLIFTIVICAIPITYLWIASIFKTPFIPYGDFAIKGYTSELNLYGIVSAIKISLYVILSISFLIAGFAGMVEVVFLIPITPALIINIMAMKNKTSCFYIISNIKRQEI
jgi:hypothetical protein